jgi:hypothetical protein
MSKANAILPIILKLFMLPSIPSFFVGTDVFFVLDVVSHGGRE